MLIPKKSLGQNFLIDKNIVNKIVNLVNIKNKNIVEIGPGTGQLTSEILKKKPKKLILLEKDVNLFIKLKDQNKDIKNLEIYNLDALKYNYSNLEKINVISNLP